MLTYTELVAALRDTMADVLQVDGLGSDTDLVELGILDSFGLVNLLYALEEQFGVQITLQDLEQHSFRSIEGIASFLGQRLV